MQLFIFSRTYIIVLAVMLVAAALASCSSTINIWEAIESDDISKVKKAIAAQGVKLVIPLEDGTTPLMRAVNRGVPVIVDALIKAKVNVNDRNKQGVTALYIATAKGNNRIVELLIKAEADINTANGEGVSPLLIALLNGHLETAELLIKSKANVNASDVIGQTPLYVVVSKGYLNLSKLLIRSKADVNKTGKNGISPLFLAVITNNVELIDLLLQAKADPDVRVNWLGKRQTAVEYARNTGRDKILTQLMVYSKGPSSTKPASSIATPLTLSASIAQGKKIYMANCAACHQANGKGIPPTFPALKNSPLLVNGSSIKAIKTILNGKRIMPAFSRMSDLDLAQVMTYIRNSWGHSNKLVTPAEIKAQR